MYISLCSNVIKLLKLLLVFQTRIFQLCAAHTTYTLIICCILLVVIFYFYALWQKLEGIYLYIVIFLGAASALYGIINVLILFKKRSMDKQ